MNYNKIKEENEKHIKNICSWLIEEVCSSCGDGDGIWFSKFFDAEDIADFITVNNLCPEHWVCNVLQNGFLFVNGQESLVITNSQEVFDARPSWQQVSLIY